MPAETHQPHKCKLERNSTENDLDKTRNEERMRCAAPT